MRYFFLALVVSFTYVVTAAVPRQIAYQGVLTDANGNPRPDGKYHFSFQLFDVATGGTALNGFGQTNNQPESLTVKNGVFSTVLGRNGGISLSFDKQYWLGVTVNGTAMTQRVALTSAAYAMRSAVADSAGKSKMADSAIAVRGLVAALASKESVGHGHSSLQKPGDTAKAVVVNAAAQVGIGAAILPSTGMLQVNGLIDVLDTWGGAFRIYNGTTFRGGVGTRRWAQGPSPDSTDFSIFAERGLALHSGGKAEPNFYFNPNGNVGIGTNNPLARLHLLSSTEVLRLDRPANTTTGYVSFYTGNIPYAFIGLENSSGTGLFGSGQENGLSIGTVENTGISFHTSNVPTPRMVVSGEGNIGIGTMSPKTQLHLDFGSNRKSIQMESDGNQNAFSDLQFTIKTTAVLQDEDIVDWILSHRKDGYFTGGASSSTLELYGVRKGGGYVVPFAAKKNGDVILAGNSSVVRSGNVGIGTISPEYKLDVNGTIRGTNVAPSDRRFKTNIIPIDSALTKISSLRGVTYDWDSAAFPARNFSTRKQIGLIAQQVESVLPELVHTDSEGYKSPLLRQTHRRSHRSGQGAAENHHFPAGNNKFLTGIPYHPVTRSPGSDVFDIRSAYPG